MKNIIIGMLVLSILIMSGCGTDSVSVTTKSDNLPTINANELCEEGDSMANTCFEAVAQYNGDATLCDKIDDASRAQNCKNEIAQGKLSLRKYEVLTAGLNIDTNIFIADCKTTCASEGMKYRSDERQTINDPYNPTSIGGYASSSGLDGLYFSSCRCY